MKTETKFTKLRFFLKHRIKLVEVSALCLTFVILLSLSAALVVGDYFDEPTYKHSPMTFGISWTFHVYSEPNFESEVINVLDPQRVQAIEVSENGWILIDTYSGDGWVYPRANMRFLYGGATLFDSIAGTPVDRIEQQVAPVLNQHNNWIQISTWLGPKWVLPRQHGERLITLTFDDGPSLYTIRLLDELLVRGIPATFYVLGSQVSARPDIAQRIVNEGHEIASHSYHHRLLSRMSAAEIRNQLARTQDVIYQTTGATATLFRPPYGGQNETVRAVAAEFGLPIILWSVDTRDWETRSVNAILSHFVDGNGNIRIRDGDIILMHDIWQPTIDAAIRAMDLLLADGFTFVTNSELLLHRRGPLTPGAIYRDAR